MKIRILSGVEDDGRQQPEGHAVAAGDKANLVSFSQNGIIQPIWYRSAKMVLFSQFGIIQPIWYY